MIDTKQLLDFGSSHPELYNRVANTIYKNFGFQSAEVVLFTTYVVNEILTDRKIPRCGYKLED